MADTREKQLELRYRQRKDEEIKRLVAEREAVEHRLGKTQQDLTKMQSHSKTQSQKVQGLLKDMQVCVCVCVCVCVYSYITELFSYALHCRMLTFPNIPKAYGKACTVVAIPVLFIATMFMLP